METKEHKVIRFDWICTGNITKVNKVLMIAFIEKYGTAAYYLDNRIAKWLLTLFPYRGKNERTIKFE